LLVVLAAIMFLAPLYAQAGWQENGMSIAVAPLSQEEPEIASDGAGGAIIVWEDYNNIYSEICAQRVDGGGEALWDPWGITICSAFNHQTDPEIVPDGFGGALIVWIDQRETSHTDIYAQRVDASGTLLWGASGVLVCGAEQSQSNPRIIADGTGGAVITWEDPRSGTNYDVYAQRIGAGGTARWTADGVVVSDTVNNQNDPEMTSDGAGGAIIVWEDYRVGGGHSDIYAQRVDSAGVVRWESNGVSICGGAEDQFNAVVTADGSGGAVFVWEDYRDIVSYDIYVQRVDSAGSRQWAVDGQAICTADGNQRDPFMASDGEGGAIVVWRDTRGAASDVYAQRVNSLGGALWGEDGTAITQDGHFQTYPRVASNGCGGAVITWLDDAVDDDRDVYAQSLDASGTALWSPGGVPVNSDTNAVYKVRIASDGAGSALIVWRDSRNGDYDVYAQRIGPRGYWGYRAPRIHLVRDVAGDQGGLVDLSWHASPLDNWLEAGISQYTVWRSVTGSATAFMAGRGARVLGDIADLELPAAGDVILMQDLGGTTYFWKLMSTVQAYFLGEYSEVVPTLFDSTSVSTDYHYFQVIAHGTAPTAFWASESDSGRSVDNLAPGTPLNLAGEYESPPGELLMNWDPNTESDLSNYFVYRGATEGFVPDETNRIGEPSDTFFVDTEFNPGAEEYYKLSATDIHENESGYALLRPEDISGVGPSIPLVTALEQNVPNPFSQETVIRFSLAERGHVSLKVYDVEGRPVRTLAEGERAPDRYEARWDSRDDRGSGVAPGVYFYKLEAPGYSRTMKMVLLK
jgi:hypothetical protein